MSLTQSSMRAAIPGPGEVPIYCLCFLKVKLTFSEAVITKLSVVFDTKVCIQPFEIGENG